MDEGKSLLEEVEAGEYDSADLPFDFIEENAETALICCTAPEVREKVSAALNNLGFHISTASNARDDFCSPDIGSGRLLFKLIQTPFIQ